MSGNVEGVQPSVKDTFVEVNYKSARTHSSTEPTVAEVLAGLKNAGLVSDKGAEIQMKKGRVELEAKTQALKTTVPPVVNDTMATADDRVTIPPTINDHDIADAATVPGAETSMSHV
ncbi:hypothetical protein LIER_42149 [Lithospermum erythrorhizon]|uniref:Uncharacterized protein n=1 Tax=Lithospermum erythrorhizon TaxID=34254 RepID=A0AAV3RN33_LITER